MQETAEKYPEGCPTGSAVATAAGDLPSNFVFHAVGPIYHDGKSGEPELLASCYRVALRLARETGAFRIVLPSISTGAYGYPVRDAAGIAVATVAECLQKPEYDIDKATFVLFDEETYRAYVRAAETLLQ